MVSQPFGKVVTMALARCDVEHQALLFIDAGVDLEAVHDQEDLHRRMPNALVPINECVIGHQGKSQCGGLLDERWMEIDTIERRLRLGERRFEQAEIPNASAPPDWESARCCSATTSPSVR